MSKRAKILYALAGITAFGLAIAAAFATGISRSEFTDSGDYIEAARYLKNGAYPEAGSLPFFRPPLYPMFLAGIWTMFPESFVAVKLVQAGMHAVTALLLLRSGELIFERIAIGFAGAMIFAVHPFFLYNAAAIQTETLQTFLITIAVVLMIKGLKRGEMTLAEAAAAGITFGLATLCKPSALGIGIALAAFILVAGSRIKGSLRSAAVMTLLMFAVLLPWSAYNFASRGEFILVNDAGGFNLWLGNNPATLRLYEGEFASAEEAQVYADYLGKGLADRQIAEFEASGGYSGLSAKGREGRWRQKALETMIEQPWTTLKLWAWKLFGFWKPFLNSNVYSRSAVWLSGLVQVPVFVLGIAGLVLAGMRARTRKFVWFFVILAAAATAIHVVIVSGMRFRMPYVDPLLIVFAGAALVAALERMFPAWFGKSQKNTQ